jgi:hypothetical protein
MAGNKDPVIHAANVNLVAIDEVLILRREGVQEGTDGTGEFLQLLGATDAGTERLDVNVHPSLGTDRVADIVFQFAGPMVRFAESRFLVDFQVEFDEQMALEQ